MILFHELTQDKSGACMELDTAIELLKNAVKYTGNIDQKHIDLSIVPASELERYKKALVVAQSAIKDGKISRDEFQRRVHLDS
jgi:hypothetical protein